MRDLKVFYSEVRNELKVYNIKTDKKFFIQGYTFKKGCPRVTEMNLEMFIWLATYYEEDLKQAI